MCKVLAHEYSLMSRWCRLKHRFILKRWSVVVTLFLVCTQSSYAQNKQDLVGIWKAYELLTDRFYINLENDSIRLFNKEDQSNVCKDSFSSMIEAARRVTIRFLSDSSYIVDLMGMIETGSYHHDQENFQLILHTNNTSIRDTLRFSPAGLIEFDMTDAYETKRFIFKRSAYSPESGILKD